MGLLLGSLAQIQEVPPKNMILLVGPPGSGKSTFCHQTVLSDIEMRPVIYVTTESPPSKVVESLRQKGLGEALPHPLGFVDTFHETVGLPIMAQPDTVNASSEDLTSLDIAISKLRERVGENVLLVFDSLTSPYLMSGSEILRFIRTTLSKLAAEGNAVIACVDEGCGKEEDLVAMMSIADGIIKIELRNGSKTFNVIKHPKMKPMKINVPTTRSLTIPYRFHKEMVKQHIQRAEVRTEVGDYVNFFWPNFARWSAMLMDPKKFPTMIYNLNKQILGSEIREVIRFYPRHKRLMLKLMPKNFSEVKDVKKLTSWMQSALEGDRSGIIEYLENASKREEHYMRIHENDTCWGFKNVGATLGLMDGGRSVGALIGLEKEDRDWNAIETKCIGLGDPYCEFKAVPGKIEGLNDSLESIDSTILERIHGRIMDRLIGFMLHGKHLWNRPRLGNEISLHEFAHIMVLPAVASEKYRTAMRLGSAVTGRNVGEQLMDMGVSEDEASKHLLNLLEYFKVGKVSIDETIKMVQNCESFLIKSEEPCCYFTTGFLNGFFSTIKNQHVKETKCIAMGNPYCEWEFR